MGRIIGMVLLILLVIAGLGVAIGFGFFGWEQAYYIVQLLAGWTAFTCLIAVLYGILEKIFPGVLCAPPHEESGPSA